MIDNIFAGKQILSVTPQQMKNNFPLTSPAENFTFFSGDKISLINPNLFGNPVNIFNNSGIPDISPLPANNSNKTPTAQIMELAKRYNIAPTGDINKLQKEVIKAIVMHKAIQYDVPLNVALGICGNESTWSMWSNVNTGKLEQCKNMRSGSLSSSDWGAMQINDKSHPKAFPRAKYDLEYNIDYGLKFLSSRNNKIKGDMGLGFGQWDRTIASYNLGHNPSSSSDYKIANNYVSKVKSKSLRV